MAFQVQNISSISQALANKAETVNIPKPRNVMDSPDNSAIKHDHGTGLPTPPNSISPNLPAHSLAARVRKDISATSPPSIIESDIDLLDAVDHAKAFDQPHRAVVSSNADAVDSDGHGHITPQYLADHHLPQILQSGSQAIRDIMKELNQRIPGFGSMPPARARRIIVGALEGRFSRGPDGGVGFEKVGWGKWAVKYTNTGHQEGLRMRPTNDERSRPFSPPWSLPNSYAVEIPAARRAQAKSRQYSHSSGTGEFSRSEPVDRMEAGVIEEEVERMSLDEDQDRPCDIADPKSRVAEDSDTDIEDWESIGAAALRGGPTTLFGRERLRRPSHRNVRIASPFLTKPQSMPERGFHVNRFNRKPPQHLDFNNANSQEREAIEALLRMGSM